MTVIKIDDLRTAGAGTCQVARAWCRRNNVSYHRLRTEGIPYDEVKDVQDHRSALERVLKAAQEREERERNLG